MDYEKLLESVNDAVVVSDLNANIVFWNYGSSRFFEWKKEEILDKKIFILFDPNAQNEISKSMNEIYRGSWEGSTVILTKSGNKKYARLSVSTIFNDQMEAQYILGVFTDISELLESRIQAEEAIRIKTEFLANISHEIRTPISGILGYAELLYHDDLNKNEKEYILTIKHNSEHLLELINDLLDLSKIEVNSLILDKHFFNIKELIKSISRIFKFIINKKNLSYDIQIDPDIPNYFIGDSKRIRQVFSNLLSNAVKFTHSGGISIKVSQGDLKEKKTDQFPLEISVSDTGIGIDNDKLANIFEPFIQADSSTTRKYGGTGLGLAISKRLVELMDGYIEVSSIIRKGSTFSFTVPLGIASSFKAEQAKIYEDKEKIRKNPYIMLYLNNQSLVKQIHKSKNIIEKYSIKEIINKEKFKSMINFYIPSILVIDGIIFLELINDIYLSEFLNQKNEHMQILVLGNLSKENYSMLRNLQVINNYDNLINKLSQIELIKKNAYNDLDNETSLRYKMLLDAKKSKNILLLSSNTLNNRLMTSLLKNYGFNITSAKNILSAEKILNKKYFEIIIIDVQINQSSSYAHSQLLTSFLEHQEIPIISLLPSNTDNAYIQMIQQMSHEAIQRPIEKDILISIINNILSKKLF